jgi:hypothetical protein
MKIKVEIVDNELNPILTKYISEESYRHANKIAKDHHVTSILEEMADGMLRDIKWELEKLKNK